MFSLLNKPYPCNYGQTELIRVAILIGLFVAIFLGAFQPFGIGDREPLQIIKIVAGFGLVSTFVCLSVYIIGPKLFPGYYVEDNYTIGKDILMNLVLVSLIGLCNFLYLNAFWANLDWTISLSIIGQTFLVGIFPISFLTILNYNKLYRSNLKVSEEINSQKIKTELLSPAKMPALIIKNENKTDEIELEHLMYVESVGNYASIAQAKDDKVVKDLFRTTLKAIEEENQLSHVMRCHRSFIINLDKVTEVTGNAQGLKLSLRGSEELIPVSRKYIQSVKTYFQKVNRTNA